MSSSSYGCFVALASGVDLRDLHAEGIEPYLGLPEKNPDRWEHASILPLAENLVGKPLLIHGTSDRVIPISQNLKMLEALIQAAKPYDLVLLPGQGHIFRGTGARYAREATRRYFQDHLQP